ncbi:MAG: polysaccharide deacetylase family protein [Alphaproteobacteria bacterium]
MSKPLFTFSIDVESWIHGRWASGSTKSLWPDSLTGYKASFNTDRPLDFPASLEATLHLIDELEVPTTFFVLVEMAELFPTVIRAIKERGHEIALHGWHHVDNTHFTPEEFRNIIRRSRSRLAEISDQEIVGYRAPNLIIDSTQMAILDEEKFLYDSSVCPSRSFLGKFSNMTGAPTTPYHPSRYNLAKPGDLSLVELPLPVFPGLLLPGGTGILARAFGGWWARTAIEANLRKGYGLFYFHPYEVAEPFVLPRRTAYLRLFTRNIGVPFRSFVKSWFSNLKKKVEFVTAHDLAKRVRSRKVKFS